MHHVDFDDGDTLFVIRCFYILHANRSRAKRTLCFSAFLGGYREPGLVWWPGKIHPGSRSNALVATYDMFPTVLSLAGMSLPAKVIIDGVDLAPLIFSAAPEAASGGHDCIFFYKHPESQTGPAGAALLTSLSAIRCGDFKVYYLIDGDMSTPLPAGVTSGKQSLEAPVIFDLSKDWSEEHPLANTSAQYARAKSEAAEARAAHLQTIGWNINQMGEIESLGPAWRSTSHAA